MAAPAMLVLRSCVTTSFSIDSPGQLSIPFESLQLGLHLHALPALSSHGCLRQSKNEDRDAKS